MKTSSCKLEQNFINVVFCIKVHGSLSKQQICKHTYTSLIVNAFGVCLIPFYARCGVFCVRVIE